MTPLPPLLTEAEWLASADPRPMLPSLPRGFTDRQARLFGCACCRRIETWLTDPRSRQAVDLIERWVDDPSVDPDRGAALDLALAGREAVFRQAYAGGHDVFPPTVDASWAAYLLAFHRHPETVADQTARKCSAAMAATAEDEARAVLLQQAEQARQADLLREILGNPFRRLPPDPACHTPAAVELAQHLYASGEFHRLPELGAALAVAGCADAELLQHCLVPGLHVRGCWALDCVRSA